MRDSILDHIRAYPMVILLLPLVAAILLFIDRPPKYAPKTPPNAMQQMLYGRLAAAGLEGDELATVGALTLGYKEELDKDLRRHFQASGAAHVLAVSGLHTGIIYGLLIALLTLGGHFKPMHENRLGRCAISLIIIGAMWGYAWLTGMTPSVVRAVLMVTIFEVGHMAYKRSFSINTIAAAAVLILLVKPEGHLLRTMAGKGAAAIGGFRAPAYFVHHDTSPSISEGSEGVEVVDAEWSSVSSELLLKAPSARSEIK